MRASLSGERVNKVWTAFQKLTVSERLNIQAGTLAKKILNVKAPWAPFAKGNFGGCHARVASSIRIGETGLSDRFAGRPGIKRSSYVLALCQNLPCTSSLQSCVRERPELASLELRSPVRNPDGWASEESWRSHRSPFRSVPSFYCGWIRNLSCEIFHVTGI